MKERIRILGHFGQWLDHSPATASLDEIVEYLAVGEWAPSTRATYYSVLRAWFLWLQRLEHRPDNPMLHVSPPRVPRRQPHPVSSHGLVRVLGTHMHRRTRVMILLYCLGGIRCAEIARFRGEWVDIEARTMTVLGKGGVTATLPMHPLLVEVAQTMPREGWWFPTNASRPEGGHVRGKSVGRIIKNVFVRAGVQGSAHSLRHWFGTSLVENDVDLRTTQELMRHASLATTQLYTLVSDQRKARGVERLDPWRSSSEGTAA